MVTLINLFCECVCCHDITGSAQWCGCYIHCNFLFFQRTKNFIWFCSILSSFVACHFLSVYLYAYAVADKKFCACCLQVNSVTKKCGSDGRGIQVEIILLIIYFWVVLWYFEVHCYMYVLQQCAAYLVCKSPAGWVTTVCPRKNKANCFLT